MDFKNLDTYLHQYTPLEQLFLEQGQPKFPDHQPHPIYHIPQEMDSSQMKLELFPDFLVSSKNFLITRQDRFSQVFPHSHHWIEIQYVYSGSCRQIIDGRKLLLHAGEVLCLDTDVIHSCEETGKEDIIINILLKRDYFKATLSSRIPEQTSVNQFIASMLSDRISHRRFLHVQENEALHFLFRYLLCEYYSPSINAPVIYESALSLILSELTNLSERQEYQEHLSAPHQNIALILRYIHVHFQTCTQNSTAAFFHISPGHLTRLIKKHTGLTYKELVQQLKLNYAESLLKNTSLSIEAVCHEAGYENQSYFYEIFRRKNHCSPKEFRQLS